MMHLYLLVICLLSPSVLQAAGAAQAPDPGPVPAMVAPKAAEYRLLDITVAGSRAIAVGQHGVILTSEDGANWKQSPVPVSTMLTNVQFTDADTGWVVGYDGTILKSSDGGQSWQIKHYDLTARPLFDLLFLDQQRVLAVGGYGTQLLSVDGGESWTEIENSLSDAGMHLNEILQFDDGTLFIAGERGLMARSSDQGDSWELLESPYKGSFFGALRWGGDKGVLLYGMRGNVFVVNDVSSLKVAEELDWDIFSSGVTVDPEQVSALGMRHLDNPSRESLFGAMLEENGRILFVGVNGSILRYVPDREALADIRTDIDQTLAGVTRFNGRTLAVGRRGIQLIAPLGAQ